MDRFHALAVFVAVAEEESFARGARRLGMSPPAVTRAVASLERRLGVKLLTRTTRFVRATDAGQRYLERARRLIAEADEADEAIAGAHAGPRGQLSVTAPVLFGRMYVTPCVVEYLRSLSGNVRCGRAARPRRQPARGGTGRRRAHRRAAGFDLESGRHRLRSTRGMRVAGISPGARHTPSRPPT